MYCSFSHRQNQNHLNQLDGFALMEIILATAILAVALSCQIPLIRSLIYKENENQKILVAIYAAEQKIEHLKTINFEELESSSDIEVAKLAADLKRIKIKIWKNQHLSTLRYKN